MTTQANAYYANKLKEKELNEVKVPQVQLTAKELEEVKIPGVAIDRSKVEETRRANLATEEQRRNELAEERRYHDMSHAVNVGNLTENKRYHDIQHEEFGQSMAFKNEELDFRRDTTLTAQEQGMEKELDRIAKVSSSPTAATLYTTLGGAYQIGQAEGGQGTAAYRNSRVDNKPGDVENSRYVTGVGWVISNPNNATPTQLVYDKESSTDKVAWYRVPSTTK